MKKLNFPELRQTYEYDCGAKALQSVLVYYGIEISEENLLKTAGTNKIRGTTRKGMTRVLKKYGLKSDDKEMKIKELKTYINKKIPVIILLQAWDNVPDYSKKYKDGHWAVAIGYDKNKIIFEDPYSFERTYLTEKELKERWHSKERKMKIKNYGIAVYGKIPKYDSKKIIHMG